MSFGFDDDGFHDLPEVVQDAVGDYILQNKDGPEYTIEKSFDGWKSCTWVVFKAWEDSTSYTILVGCSAERRSDYAAGKIEDLRHEGLLEYPGDFATFLEDGIPYFVYRTSVGILFCEVHWESNLMFTDDVGLKNESSNRESSEVSLGDFIFNLYTAGETVPTYEFPDPDTEVILVDDNGNSVNHPNHYGGADNPYEAIKVIDAWGLGFSLGNAVKYISRAGKKGDNAYEDIQKAAWYLNHWLENN